MDQQAYASALQQLREAITMLEAAGEQLWQLANERGQADPALPLIIEASDTELRAAVDREVAAHKHVEQALAAVREANPL
jgi:fructose-1-phosphate kinase PfkB-like protein